MCMLTRNHTHRNTISQLNKEISTHIAKGLPIIMHTCIYTQTHARAQSHAHTHTVCFKMSSPNDHLMKRGKAL